jgi:arylsulfatase B
MAFLYNVQLIALALAVGVATVVRSEPSAPSPQPPNLVHIVVDDLGFNDVGYKNAEVLSPNLDMLRAEGVELARFYSAKWCAPSRATMLTGRYAWRSGYYSDQTSAGVSLDTELLPAVLQRAGYRTYVRNCQLSVLHHVAVLALISGLY